MRPVDSSGSGTWQVFEMHPIADVGLAGNGTDAALALVASASRRLDGWRVRDGDADPVAAVGGVESFEPDLKGEQFGSGAFEFGEPLVEVVEAALDELGFRHRRSST
jgi:hypothetical protein